MGEGTGSAVLQCGRASLAAPGRNIQILRPLEDVEVMEKESATFSCEVSYDDVSAQWFREGSKLRSSDNVRMRQEGVSTRVVAVGGSHPIPHAPPPVLSGPCSQEGHIHSSTGGFWWKKQEKSDL